MNRWQPFYLLGCIGLSAGVNHVTRPQVDYALSAGERTMTTGSLVFEQDGRVYRFRLATIHVIAADVPRLMTVPLTVRALWMRSPEEEGQPVPDVELLFDMAAGVPPIDRAARDAALVRSRQLPVLPDAPGAELHSQVRLPGADAPTRVQSGDVLITEALELRKGDPSQGWRVRGEVHLDMEGVRGGQLVGKFDARLVW